MFSPEENDKLRIAPDIPEAADSLDCRLPNNDCRPVTHGKNRGRDSKPAFDSDCDPDSDSELKGAGRLAGAFIWNAF
jgi:hypothetical protein